MAAPTGEARLALIAKVEAVATPSLRSEIQYHLEGIEREDDDGTYDALSALFDVEDRAERNADRPLLTAARKALISIGFFRPMDDAEVRNTWVSSGTAWHFKLGGVPYTTDETTVRWQFPDSEQGS